jgi:hypothetical protein
MRSDFDGATLLLVIDDPMVLTKRCLVPNFSKVEYGVAEYPMECVQMNEVFVGYLDEYISDMGNYHGAKCSDISTTNFQSFEVPNGNP